MNTVRGITSRVDIVWSSNGLEIQRSYGINVSFSRNNSTLYTSIYTIPQLNTTDDGKVYQCEVVINTSPPVMATSSVTLDVTVSTPTVSITPSGPIQGAMVGSPQDIHCTVNTVSGVELSSVMINWMGPGGDTITNDSRVTISPTSGSGNNYTSSLQFMYLMEGDEGTYECNVVTLETDASVFVIMNNFIGKHYNKDDTNNLYSLYIKTVMLLRLYLGCFGWVINLIYSTLFSNILHTFRHNITHAQNLGLSNCYALFTCSDLTSAINLSREYA